jgi:hypothetical protein
LSPVAADLDQDGDIDVVSGAKSGLFLPENVGVMAVVTARRRRP